MTRTVAQISAGGRIVIPAEIRRKMGIRPGDQVVLSFRDGQLHIATRKQRLQQAKKLVQSYTNKKSLAEELISERRAEADD